MPLEFRVDAADATLAGPTVEADSFDMIENFDGSQAAEIERRLEIVGMPAGMGMHPENGLLSDFSRNDIGTALQGYFQLAFKPPRKLKLYADYLIERVTGTDHFTDDFFTRMGVSRACFLAFMQHKSRDVVGAVDALVTRMNALLVDTESLADNEGVAAQKLAQLRDEVDGHFCYEGGSAAGATIIQFDRAKAEAARDATRVRKAMTVPLPTAGSNDVAVVQPLP